jgi:hypothetical protein
VTIVSEIPEGWMTTTQAAAFLGVTPSSVLIYVKKGLLRIEGHAPGKGSPGLVSVIAVKKLAADRAEGKGTTPGGRPKKSTTAPPVAKRRAATLAEHLTGFEAVLRWILDGAACGALTADEALERIRAELDK